MNSDNLGDTLSRNTQCIVCLAKGIENSEIRIYLAQTLIVDDKQGINMLRHFLNTIKSLINLSVALKPERNSDNSHRKNTHLL